MITKIPGVLFVILAMVAFTACGDDDDNNKEPESQVAKVRVLHASPDAPAVNVLVDGTAVLEAVDYTVGSGLIDLDEGTYSVQVDGILPGGDTAKVIGPVDLNFMADTRYDIMAVNTVDKIEPIIVTAPAADVADDMVRVAVVHAAANAPEVDVYVTAPGADLGMSSPLGTFEFKGTLGPVEVPPGDYQVRVTAAGTTTVAFDSGTVSVEGGDDFVIAAVTNTGNGASPVQLVVLDGEGSEVIMDAATPASLRVIHNSPDAPAVDIVVNDGFEAPLVEDLAFPDATDYVDVPADTYNVKVLPAGTTNPVVIEADLTVAQGMSYSVYAVNTLDMIEPLVLEDTTRRIATEAKVRLIHGSPAAGEVDIYVTAPDADISMAEPAFTAVPFKAETGFVPLAPGDYQVRITPTGTKDVAIDTGTLTLSGGGIYTAVARDNTGGGLPLGVIVLDDFVAP